MRRTRSFGSRALPLALALAFLIVTLLPDPADAGRRARGKKPAPAPTISPELEGQLWGILESGTRSGDIPARGMAVESITYLRPGQSLTYATDGVKDPQWAVRAGAFRALMRMGNGAYEKPLQDALARGGADVASQIVPLFERLPEATALSLLFAVLDAPTVPNKKPIVQALASRGGPFAAAAFGRGLAGRGTPHPVFRAFLDEMGESHVAMLTVAAKGSDPGMLQAVVARAAQLPAHVELDFLRPLLASKSDDVRIAAAKLLASRGDTSATPALIPLLAEGNPLDGRIEVMYAIAGAPTPAAVTAVLAVLTDEEPPPPDVLAKLSDAVFAVHAAAGDSEVLPTVHGFLRGTDANLRIVAVRHLGRIHGPRALPNLHELLFDGNPEVRKGAARSLGDAAQSESLPHLQRAMDDRDQEVRRTAAEAMAAIHDKAVVDVVAFLVTDRDPAVRASAAKALAGARHASALPSLRLALNDRDKPIRLTAFRGMLAIDPAAASGEWSRVLSWIEPADLKRLAVEGGASFQPFLEKALASGRDLIRAAALDATENLSKTERLTLMAKLVRDSSHMDVRLSALARIEAEQGGSATPIVQDLTRDAELAMRRAAILTLGRIGPAAAVDVLQAYLVDGDEGIRISAASAILAILFRQG